MKSILSVAVLGVLAIVGTPLARAQVDALALAIVYDTSGSMKDPVRTSTGANAPKYTVANRALAGVAKALQSYASAGPADAPRQVSTALFTFQGEHARAAMPLKPLDAAALQGWAAGFRSPQGNTPLGESLKLATECVLKSSAGRKHVLVITDGLNTAGPKPETVLPALKKQAASKGSEVGVHFVAFDIDAKVFQPLKKQGVTVVSAADERQLTAQLDFILQKKILLEDEEPLKTEK